MQDVAVTAAPAAPRPIGAFGAFALLLALGLLAPWPLALVLVLFTAGGAAIVMSLVPQLYLAVFPFLFATTDRWSGNSLFPWPLGLLLTVLQWVAISAAFSYYAQSLSRVGALKVSLRVVAVVWLICLLGVVALGVHAPLSTVRT
jgi:hypothetical protein